jgi:hypothetical protein
MIPESNTAVFSPCRLYRYTLWRRWSTVGEPDKFLQVIGLNPSTADETQDDPTIRRCIDFAKRWGYGALCMTNLFAWRDTLPENMKKAADPVGEENDRWLAAVAGAAGMTLAAWGKHGSHLGRAKKVLAMLPQVHYLKLNGDGSPGHPLYIKGDTLPKPFQS